MFQENLSRNHPVNACVIPKLILAHFTEGLNDMVSCYFLRKSRGKTNRRSRSHRRGQRFKSPIAHYFLTPPDTNLIPTGIVTYPSAEARDA